MNENEDIIDRLKQICKEYSDILGVVILFGSLSRGEQNANSDIDLYIEPKDENMTTSMLGRSSRYKDFKYELYDSLPYEFDLLSYGGRRDIDRMKKSPLWSQIKKDGVLIYDQGAKAV